MTKAEKKLPAKLSDCLEVALADLTAVERMKAYTINMGDWHAPRGPRNLYGKVIEQTSCSVCFAGSVMARTLKVAPTERFNPEDFSEHNSVRFSAINALRCGSIGDAFETIGKELPWGLIGVVGVQDYDSNPAEFKRDMRKLVKLLRVFGE